MIIQLTDTLSAFLTNHAIQQMNKRQIREIWIKQVLIDPIIIEQDPKDFELKWAFGAITCDDGSIRILKVVYNDQVTPLKIVTLHFDRNAKNRFL